MLPSSTSLIFFLRSPRKCLKASLAFYRAWKRERSAINSAQSPDSSSWSISIAPQRISLKKRYICWANLKSAHFTYYKKKMIWNKMEINVSCLMTLKSLHHHKPPECSWKKISETKKFAMATKFSVGGKEEHKWFIAEYCPNCDKYIYPQAFSLTAEE